MENLITVLVTSVTSFVGAQYILKLLRKGYYTETTACVIYGMAKEVSVSTLPDLGVRITSLFNQHVKKTSLLLKVNRYVSNAKALSDQTPAIAHENIILASITHLVR